MAYNKKDNPLKGVKVEMPEFCKSRNHTVDLLIWGGCTTCQVLIPSPKEDTSVFERLENLKKLGV